MYAIVESGGKQYKVSKDDIIFVEKIEQEVDSLVDLKVLAVCNEGNLLVNKNLDSAKVTGKILKNGKAKKITVFTYKPKKNKKRKLGHRQPYSKLQVQEILI